MHGNIWGNSARTGKLMSVLTVVEILVRIISKLPATGERETVLCQVIIARDFVVNEGYLTAMF